MKGTFPFILLCGVVLGFLIATAGVAVAPSLGKVSAPFVCRDGLVVVSQHYSYKPGQAGVTRDFFCSEDLKKENPRTLFVFFWSLIVYTAGAILLVAGLVFLKTRFF